MLKEVDRKIVFWIYLINTLQMILFSEFLSLLPFAFLFRLIFIKSKGRQQSLTFVLENNFG